MMGQAPPRVLKERSALGEHDKICYGMIEKLPIHATPNTPPVDAPNLMYATLDDHGTIQRRSDGAIVGRLGDTAQEIMRKLNDVPDVYLQLMFNTANNQRLAKKKTSHASVIIYGPEIHADDVGDFLDQCGYYLQDPFSCEMNVPYKNPHCLASLFEPPVMTSGLAENGAYGRNDLSVSESLQALTTNEVFPEWEQPCNLQAQLLDYQRQSLWFFMKQESFDKAKSIWRCKQNSTNFESPIYVDTISGREQDTLPPTWNGGILADEMGLGKTLQMISLIAASKASLASTPSPCGFDGMDQSSQTHPLPTTLVVVTPPLLDVWEHELERHTVHGQLTWQRHHGRNHFQAMHDSNYPDILLTTYQKVQAEYRNRRSNGLFEHHWRRIILDEAHMIRNKTITATAICSLQAISRWAVTGTPIQNRLEDLCGLFEFLRCQPYDNRQTVDKEIFQYIRGKNHYKGVERLKDLCAANMIRRTSSILSLPPRQDHVIEIEFNDKERLLYQSLESSLQNTSTKPTEPAVGREYVWMRVIQLINKLRQICNLGVASGFETAWTQPVCPPLATTPGSVDGGFIASQVALGGAICDACDISVTLHENTNSIYGYYSACGKVFCPNCASLSHDQRTPGCLCSENNKCTLHPMSTAVIRRASNDDAGDASAISHQQTSSKVSAVVEDITQHQDEKSVVFSFWTSSLNMVQEALSEKGIRYVRIDGSMDPAKRKMALHELRVVEDVKVLLITVSCGGVGLDITAASRAYLLEPQWNPAVEEQALARVHRMGQQRPVTTIRYIMKNSIEVHVASAKKQKELLATLLPENKYTKAAAEANTA